MRSGTSFFDLTIYRKTVSRFWPLWAVNLVVWLFILPFNGLVTLSNYIRGGRTGNSMYRFAQNVGDMATEWGVIFALCAGLVVAMAVCSHLYNHRSANFMGSLPCRREGQFFSVFLAGLTILLAPNLLIFLLTLLVEAAAGFVIWASLLYWLAALSAMEFFFFAFALCLGQFTGHILVLPVFYGVFNAIVIAVWSLMSWVLDVYYFGYSSVGIGESVVSWLTPVVPFLQMDIDFFEENGVQICRVTDLWVAAVYAAVAVVLVACALLLYRRRHLETAGDIVSVRAMRPVFKYGVAVCAGLFGGVLLQQVFGLDEVGMLLFILFWGIVGYFVAQMLLDKSVRVFKKWKGAAAVTAAFLVLFAVIGFDLTGYETRVPNPNNVARVEIDGLYGDYYDSGYSLSNVVLTEPQDIAAVVALHEGIVYVGEQYAVPPAGDTRWVHFRVEYKLKSGRVLRRDYDMRMDAALLERAQAVRDLYSARVQAYGLHLIAGWEAEGYRLSGVEYIHEDEVGRYDLTQDLVPYAENLWAAAMKDFEAGRIGTHDVGGDQYKSAEHHRLSFQWSRRMNGSTQHRTIEFLLKPGADSTWELLKALLPEVKETEKSLEDLMAGV